MPSRSHSHSDADGHTHAHSHSASHTHHAGDHAHPHPHPEGHNGWASARQWQTPHLPADHQHPQESAVSEPDLDLVETAFLDAFPSAPDPTSFLRLAEIPFVAKGLDGAIFRLLRVETESVTDIGALTPHLGGAGHRYDPLPAAMTSRRKSLAFVYFDGASLVRLSLAAAKALQAIDA